MSTSISQKQRIKLRDVWTLEEILSAMNVEGVNRDNIVKTMKKHIDKSLQFTLKQYIHQYHPALYKSHQQSQTKIIEFSQYKNFNKLTYQKQSIINGFIRHNFDILKWTDQINSIISMYYEYFILCHVKSSGFGYVSPNGIVMESFCRINGKNVEINNKPHFDGIEGRGIHLITMDNIHGNIINHNNFDAWGNFHDDIKFTNACKTIKANNICVMFAKDAADRYSENGLNVLRKKYNIQTKVVQYRSSYISIFETNENNNGSYIYYQFDEKMPSKEHAIAIKLCQHSNDISESKLKQVNANHETKQINERRILNQNDSKSSSDEIISNDTSILEEEIMHNERLWQQHIVGCNDNSNCENNQSNQHANNNENGDNEKDYVDDNNHNKDNNFFNNNNNQNNNGGDDERKDDKKDKQDNEQKSFDMSKLKEKIKLVKTNAIYKTIQNS
eukprot:434372_1